ncbi:MAG: hypothetical protein H0T56_07045 [Pseudaminobacter sp.]|nr:hypothetical protein [Pseudaminobacter sp.]
MTLAKLRIPTRRRFLQALLAIPAVAFFRNIRQSESDDMVEVDGWILKRSDIL